MKRLITILIVVAITLLAALVTPWLIEDPGYFYLRFAGYEVEMRFIVAFGLLVLFVFLFWLIVYFMRMPKKISQHVSSNRSRKSFAKGLLALSEGKWKAAEKLLVQSTKNSPTPELGFMAAARAAISQNKLEKAFDYLDEAEAHTDNPLTIDLTRCELWIKIGKNQPAIDLLKRILRSYPNNPRALNLLLQASQNAEQWQELRHILPKVEKLTILPQEQVLVLTEHSIVQQLTQAQSVQDLQNIWDSLNSTQRSSYQYIHAYADNGLKLGMNEPVAKLTESALAKNFSSELLVIWRQLDNDHQHKMKVAEKWLKKHPDDAELLQVLGELCLHNQLWGKAYQYLQKSLDIEPSAQTYKLMAHYFDAVNEPENALQAYRQAENKPPQMLLTDETASVTE